ncbi:tRNA lysidine(34) synthetase TilS [Luteimicrobium sp. NPDC057192]|uniref:tRNA lysidine(34) synthetase TilS n=1 Tax=Luteimicrobium sp. NPDC057192 TaxID=3346042 RepID=UPI0036305ACE
MAGPTPSEAAARVALRGALADLPRGALVLVACSGGADSLALAATAAFVAPRAGLRAGAVVVDHGLQPGSDDVAATAARACRGLGLDPVEVRGVVVAGSGGPEAAAREARYAALDDAAREHGADAVLLAHTLDDQAETVLLGLARGSGARSLAGMPPVRGVLRRPFLGLRRADTEAVCHAVGLTWWDDPTNGPPGDGASPNRRASSSGGARDDDPRRFDALPLRSRVRTEVLPELTRVLGPGVPAALARTAAQLRDDADVLDALATDLLVRADAAATTAQPPRSGASPSANPTSPSANPTSPSANPTSPSGNPTSPSASGTSPSVDLDVRVLEDAPRALRTRALRLAATRAGSPGGALTAAHVEALDALVVRWHGQRAVHLPGPVLGARECGRLVLRAVGAPRTPDPGTEPVPHL